MTVKEHLTDYLLVNLRDIEKFLHDVLLCAKEKGEKQIASIVLEGKSKDFLGILKSLTVSGRTHFYYENPHVNEAHVAAGSICMQSFRGVNRFKDAKNFVDGVKENIISSNKGCTYFLNAFTFYDENKSQDQHFQPGTVFLPQIHVYKLNDQFKVIINVEVDPQADIHALARVVWNDYEHILNNQRNVESEFKEDQEFALKNQSLSEGKDFYKRKVESAVGSIEHENYQKLVLAREFNVEAGRIFDPYSTLNHLRTEYETCHIFSYRVKGSPFFIGATPELLFEIDNKNLRTEALAGSMPRDTDSENDAVLSLSLMNSPKEVEEHKYVHDFILEQFKKLNITVCKSSELHLLKLKNIQHLKTTFLGLKPKEDRFLEIANALHPTPAIAGHPQEKAIDAIKELEDFDRGLYAGALGFFNLAGAGKMLVGLRSGLIDENKAKFYAGAGIMKMSDPQKEVEETEMKARSFLEALDEMD